MYSALAELDEALVEESGGEAGTRPRKVSRQHFLELPCTNPGRVECLLQYYGVRCFLEVVMGQSMLGWWAGPGSQCLLCFPQLKAPRLRSIKVAQAVRPAPGAASLGDRALSVGARVELPQSECPTAAGRR